MSRLLMKREKLIAQARLLVQRLERLSADSIWAHRASGYRGSLLKWIERFDAQDGEMSVEDLAYLERLVEVGFWMLENAARDVSS